ncbi:MAG: hypothetical protein ACERKN_22205 [Velocimicrobium sp.]
MEQWEEIKNFIPIGKYQTIVKNGEETGLVIQLESTENIVNIKFGAVSAFRMLDEGIVLRGVFTESEILKYKADNFSNIIYKITGGEFGKFIKNASNDLYDYLDLKHYIIITMNYLIEIVSEWEPSIAILRK